MSRKKGVSNDLESMLIRTKNDVRKIQRYKIQSQKLRDGMNWINEGDKGTRYFLNLIRAKKSRERIEEIKDDNSCSSQEDIVNAFFKFYMNPFPPKEHSHNEDDLNKWMWLIPRKIPSF